MRAEVVIIGGGFAGASTAYSLSLSGLTDVVIVEREPVCGYHASGRNAALGLQLTEDDRFTELAMRGAAILRDPPPELADAPLLSSSGSILVASKPESIEELLRRARAHDLPCEPFDAGAVVERWPLLVGGPMVGGVFFPTDGTIDIHALLAGFLAEARRRGARVETGREAIGFAPRSGGVVVETSGEPIEARCVVVAAGAWAGAVGARAGAGGPGFDPIRRHLHITQPLPELDTEAPFVWHIDEEFYVRPESGACLVSACDEVVVEACDPTAAPNAVPDLAAKLERAAPRLSEFGVARTWACLRTFTRGTGRPLIGWDDRVDWLFWTAGLGGHGATCSPAVGDVSAAAILERLR